MVPLMQAEVVDSRGWMSEVEFLDALAAGYALPGPIATKMSLLIGFHAGGWAGAMAGLLGMVLPSALMIIAVVFLLDRFQDSPRMAGLMRAVRPVVLAILAAMVLDLAPASLASWQSWALGGMALAALFLGNVHPLWVLVGAAVLGFAIPFKG